MKTSEEIKHGNRNTRNYQVVIQGIIRTKWTDIAQKAGLRQIFKECVDLSLALSNLVVL